MPGRMAAEVFAPGKSSPRGYLDYAARADTSLAKGVAILRQLPSRNGSNLSLRYYLLASHRTPIMHWPRAIQLHM